MPNPFKKQGISYQQGGEWIASGVGLTAKLATELASGERSSIALIGSVGSGKSTALGQCATSVNAGVVLTYKLDELEHDQALSLDKRILNELIDCVGTRAFDEAAKDLKLIGLTATHVLSRDQRLRLIQRMAEQSLHNDGKPIHVLLDECQVPSEKIVGEVDPAKMAEWFGLLKVLAERLTASNGRLILTITASPWNQVPPYAQARFVALRADSLPASELDAFIKEGLKHTGGDRPDRAARGLGGRILRAHEGEVVTVRMLHEWLHIAWDRAHRNNDAQLGAAHLA